MARGTLALSTLPVMTMLVGAALGIEALSARKSVGVLVASAAIVSRRAHAPRIFPTKVMLLPIPSVVCRTQNPRLPRVACPCSQPHLQAISLSSVCPPRSSLIRSESRSGLA